MSVLDLSIVIPTCNRADLLERNLASLRDGVRCAYEVVVVDGASEDGTAEVLARAAEELGDRLKVIREPKREGFVRAANKGFAAATARNLVWLNDDSWALPGTLDEAVRQMDGAAPGVGFLAMYHRYASTRSIAYEVEHEGKPFRLCHVRGTLYANFPIGRRETYRTLGYFDERFYFFGADPDLSLKAWNAGLRVEPAHGCFIDHDEHPDDRRQQDIGRGAEDNRKLFAKWNLPEKNLLRNDFNPARPCTLRGLRADLPTVSFLISTFNRKSTLLNTLGELKSLENKPEFNVETVVVDNASTDGSADAVATEFGDVKLVRLKKNLGACAKNAGVDLAGGEFVVFLDDDSYPDADSIRRMIEHFRDDPRLGAAVFEVILPNGNRESSALPSVCIGCGSGFRREALVAAGGLPDDFFMQAEEYDLSLRILDAGWDVRQFGDIRVQHLKTAVARQPTRTTRLDARNNLLVIARRFPGRFIWPYAMDWTRRYGWMAGNRGWAYRIAFWRGVLEGIVKSLMPGWRRVVSDGAFEKFSMMREIRCDLGRASRQGKFRSIVLVDVGKNIYPFWLAARELGLEIVAVADSRLARPGRKYRGIPVVDDAAARGMNFDAAVLTNVSPVHGEVRRVEWLRSESRPLLHWISLAPPQTIITRAA